MLAGISMPYYIRLEQGHDRHPSPQVVDALGHALCLDHETFAYFKRLAGQVPVEARPPVKNPCEARWHNWCTVCTRWQPSSSVAVEMC